MTCWEAAAGGAADTATGVANPTTTAAAATTDNDPRRTLTTVAPLTNVEWPVLMACCWTLDLRRCTVKGNCRTLYRSPSPAAPRSTPAGQHIACPGTIAHPFNSHDRSDGLGDPRWTRPPRPPRNGTHGHDDSEALACDN